MIKTINMGNIGIADFLVISGMVKSKAEAKRLIKQGAVWDYTKEPERLELGDYVGDGDLIKCGKLRWKRARFPDEPMMKFEVFEFTSAEEERAWLESLPNFNQETIERYMKDDWGE